MLKLLKNVIKKKLIDNTQLLKKNEKNDYISKAKLRQRTKSRRYNSEEFTGGSSKTHLQFVFVVLGRKEAIMR